MKQIADALDDSGFRAETVSLRSLSLKSQTAYVNDEHCFMMSVVMPTIAPSQLSSIDDQLSTPCIGPLSDGNFTGTRPDMSMDTTKQDAIGPRSFVVMLTTSCDTVRSRNQFSASARTHT
ncbi:unnamed protein product [Angiostrongylus costaricensis]|uniref:Transcriptional regulator n=1 Tax=Angiostrongylus costaricensis TaxID=334426 RepID=A0A0R3PTP8_ANGCS|nr:unnamed protein product [Angiostrongylus costaricensis]